MHIYLPDDYKWTDADAGRLTCRVACGAGITLDAHILPSPAGDFWGGSPQKEEHGAKDILFEIGNIAHEKISRVKIDLSCHALEGPIWLIEIDKAVSIPKGERLLLGHPSKFGPAVQPRQLVLGSFVCGGHAFLADLVVPERKRMGAFVAGAGPINFFYCVCTTERGQFSVPLLYTRLNNNGRPPWGQKLHQCCTRFFSPPCGGA